jgi:hypothetical protein
MGLLCPLQTARAAQADRVAPCAQKERSDFFRSPTFPCFRRRSSALTGELPTTASHSPSRSELLAQATSLGQELASPSQEPAQRPSWHNHRNRRGSRRCSRCNRCSHGNDDGDGSRGNGYGRGIGCGSRGFDGSIRRHCNRYGSYRRCNHCSCNCSGDGRRPTPCFHRPRGRYQPARKTSRHQE